MLNLLKANNPSLFAWKTLFRRDNITDISKRRSTKGFHNCNIFFWQEYAYRKWWETTYFCISSCRICTLVSSSFKISCTCSSSIALCEAKKALASCNRIFSKLSSFCSGFDTYRENKKRNQSQANEFNTILIKFIENEKKNEIND